MGCDRKQNTIIDSLPTSNKFFHLLITFANRMSSLIWIQTVWCSDSVPKKLFGKVNFEKKSADNIQGGQSRDTHVVISHVLFIFFPRFKVCFTIIFLFFGGFQKCHLVQSTKTRKFFLMALKF